MTTNTNTQPTPALLRWFEYMDSDDPDRVLTMISADFRMSVQFSKGHGEAAEFVGDRDGLVAYLQQREKSTLVHHLDRGASVDGVEMVLDGPPATEPSRPRSTRRHNSTTADVSDGCSSPARRNWRSTRSRSARETEKKRARCLSKH